MSLRKILIANRGEIALRVMRTARALGYRTVAVHSEADADAPHVAQADEAVCIGPAASAQSYLNVEAILQAARQTGADALHPGYGFLSENAGFARACGEAGLVFIGPPPEAIHAMGDKARAKRRMIEAGVPCVPGYLGEQQDDATLTAQAQTLGLPLLVKAVAGGGGRGMRLVHQMSELPQALAGARREAVNAFGDGTLMLERLIERGRHIEVQVFADAHGQAVHLGERDCTTQRRRQKVIEEAPSPIVSPAMRAAMGRDAVAAALAVGYRGAGTVEFIVDEAMNHYFLEMNTRLQVEHPVTECITGFDLVEWQLRVAAGEPLAALVPGLQEGVRLNGHAIEVRLYAEDPYAGFAPQTGRILHWAPAATQRPGVRIDHGIAAGGEVTPHYDAMVAKFIAHGRDRADAVRRLTAALEDTPLVGLRHNARFLVDLLRHDDFARAALNTGTLDDWSAQKHPLLQAPLPDDLAWCLAAAWRGAPPHGAATPLRSRSVAAFDMPLTCGDARRLWRVTHPATGEADLLHLQQGERSHTLRWLAARADHTVRVLFDGVRRDAVVVNGADGQVHVALGAAVFVFQEPSAAPRADAAHDPRIARAPVAGVVAQVLVAEGDRVTAGQPLLCVEAMKMEMWLNARTDGTVRSVRAALRDNVKAGAVLVEIDPLQPEPQAS